MSQLTTYERHALAVCWNDDKGKHREAQWNEVLAAVEKIITDREEGKARPHVLDRDRGGNQFIEPDSTVGDLMSSINDQLGDIRVSAYDDGKVMDLGGITIVSERIMSGRISVAVGANVVKKES